MADETKKKSAAPKKEKEVKPEAAVKTEATVGEVAAAMRKVFGEYQERLVL